MQGITYRSWRPLPTCNQKGPGHSAAGRPGCWSFGETQSHPPPANDGMGEKTKGKPNSIFWGSDSYFKTRQSGWPGRLVFFLGWTPENGFGFPLGSPSPTAAELKPSGTLRNFPEPSGTLRNPPEPSLISAPS